MKINYHYVCNGMSGGICPLHAKYIISTFNIILLIYDLFISTCNILMTKGKIIILTCEIIIFTCELNNVACQHHHVSFRHKQVACSHVDIIFLVSRGHKYASIVIAFHMTYFYVLEFVL